LNTTASTVNNTTSALVTTRNNVTTSSSTKSSSKSSKDATGGMSKEDADNHCKDKIQECGYIHSLGLLHWEIIVKNPVIQGKKDIEKKEKKRRKKKKPQ
jgi:hypothetical protein